MSELGRIVLFCDKNVTRVCHKIKQIFHSSSKNRSDMALHILLAVLEYLLIIMICGKRDNIHSIAESYDKKVQIIRYRTKVFSLF